MPNSKTECWPRSSTQRILIMSCLTRKLHFFGDKIAKLASYRGEIRTLGDSRVQKSNNANLGTRRFPSFRKNTILIFPKIIFSKMFPYISYYLLKYFCIIKAKIRGPRVQIWPFIESRFNEFFGVPEIIQKVLQSIRSH